MSNHLKFTLSVVIVGALSALCLYVLNQLFAALAKDAAERTKIEATIQEVVSNGSISVYRFEYQGHVYLTTSDGGIIEVVPQ